MSHGKCRGMDPNIFFPPNGHNLLTRDAIEICNGCEVQMECLDYALSNCIDHGIWGGVSERGRKRIRSARAQSLRLANGPSDSASSLHG